MMAVKIPEKEKKLLNILFHTADDWTQNTENKESECENDAW